MFEGLDPSLILPQLAALKADQIIGGKLFWKTNVKWETLKIDQRAKVLTFWLTSISKETRKAFLETARATVASEATAEKEHQR